MIDQRVYSCAGECRSGGARTHLQSEILKEGGELGAEAEVEVARVQDVAIRILRHDLCRLSVVDVVSMPIAVKASGVPKCTWKPSRRGY